MRTPRTPCEKGLGYCRVSNDTPSGDAFRCVVPVPPPGRKVLEAGRAPWIVMILQGRPTRHACRFKLANDGQDTRAHTVWYTELSA